MGKDVIVACDFSSAEKVFEFLDKFEGGRKPFVKIGTKVLLFGKQTPLHCYNVVTTLRIKIEGVLSF